MVSEKYQSHIVNDENKIADPPGKLRLLNGLKLLLNKKDFNSITTIEIAAVSGTAEALIYKHFGSKTGLLYKVLEEYLWAQDKEINNRLKKIKSSSVKLKKWIWLGFSISNKNRVFAKLLLIEVRSIQGYFNSPTHGVVRQSCRMIKEIINEGVEKGEFRTDIAPEYIQKLILGTMENRIIPAIIFDRQIPVDNYSNDLYNILFDGILRK